MNRFRPVIPSRMQRIRSERRWLKAKACYAKSGMMRSSRCTRSRRFACCPRPRRPNASKACASCCERSSLGATCNPAEDVQPPAFADEVAASRFILKEASDAIDRFVGFGQGFAGHMLTFGQSLVEMAAMGDVEWAESCRTAFRKYVTVTRMGPQPGDREIKEHQFSKLRPNGAEYWQKRGDKSLGIGHVFKYPYAYYDLLARAKDPELEKEFNAKAWRLF